MDIASIFGTGSAAGAAAPKKELGKDEFLKLFTTQLQAQNPLKPMDSSEFTAQLAQFSSLEQLYNINSQLNGMLMTQQSLQNTLAADLIGKGVTLFDGTTGIVSAISYDQAGALLVLDNGTQARLGDITQIQGGI